MPCSSLFASRRQIIRGATALGAAALFTPGAFAEALMLTPRLTEGPFYPDKMPLDKDNDLLIINDSTTPAIGEITHLTGRILTPSGAPLKNATIEIWQCDANAVYLHTRDSAPKKDQQDKNFQGFGRFETGSTGEYRFRTIKPVPYPGRPSPHIHFKVKLGDRDLLTSQIFIRGFADNQKDGVFRSTGDLIDKELVQADFIPMKDSMVGEYTANFDIVLGKTPDDRERNARR
ncbi:protocatechuate 3,4-dioxygenase [Blastopirellula marina]|uniref:Intradiol ring-cleavage dioxygenase n=1 Tax=Blastopirellula marina TaxID=124 RepID=A0A2S8GCG4_9BACT|nr:protocatechuate 3,4-dioxygenase [Blastopirellula marina]PQO41990.1 intradiol ring-cleavage dioxygenase [Blastopirellula marina]